jgi:hypothetical protein
MSSTTIIGAGLFNRPDVFSLVDSIETYAYYDRGMEIPPAAIG